MSKRFPPGIERSLWIVRGLWITAIVLLAISLMGLAGVVLDDWRAAVVLLTLAIVLHFIGRTLQRWIPRRTILEIDFERGVIEQMPRGRAARLAAGRMMAIRTIIDALERATEDPRVIGLVARIGPTHLGLAHVQEIRDGVAAFRAAGKKTVAWCPTLGEQAQGTAGYYLAAAFDEVWLQPGGSIAFNGLRISQPFVRSLLDRIGVLPQLDHRGRYKTAKYLLTEREMTEPHRESLQELLDSQVEQIIGDVARERGLDPSRVRTLLDEGLLFDQEAREAGLVDRLEFRQEAHESLRRELRGRMLDIDEYLQCAGHPYRRGTRVALIHAVGTIVRGTSRQKLVGRSTTLGADDFITALRSAVEDRKVKAIVLRIDSPGGSATASAAIWHAIRKAREAGKPVIASMSNLAGSGGYYIAAAADAIVAQPATITGSIGVVAGKMITAEAWEKIGIHWSHVQVGTQAALWSTQEPFSEFGWQRFQRLLDRTYEQFKSHVAEGRRMALEQVEAVAMGRIWSGQQAKKHGLVDELGGLRRAMALAREAAGLPPNAPVQIAEWPRPSWLPWPRRPDETICSATVLAELHALTEPVRNLLEIMDPARDDLLLMPDFRPMPALSADPDTDR